jgi:hypothetical protein
LREHKVKVLVYIGRLGPAAVFLPPGKGQVPPSAFVPGHANLTHPPQAQVAALGSKSSWASHVKVLLASTPYHGRWREEEVPDGTTAKAALAYVRYSDIEPRQDSPITQA